MPVELADGLHRWTARHPDWHPGVFGAEVASYAAQVSGGHTVVVDPLLPPDPAPVWALLDGLVRERLTVVVTIPYHVRDAEPVWERFRARGVAARIAGHARVGSRLRDATGFEELVPGTAADGIEAFAIGRPRRVELPVHLPSHAAIVFGDALVTTPEGELRIWHNEPIDERRVRFYAERFSPTLAPLVALDPARILVTHGEPILRDGRAALEAAIAAGPWYHRA